MHWKVPDAKIKASQSRMSSPLEPEKVEAIVKRSEVNRKSSMQRNPSVLSLKLAKQVVHVLAVIPADAGIQMLGKSWIPGRASVRQLARNDDRIAGED